jgi:Tfp pilus assembly protein PilO
MIYVVFILIIAILISIAVVEFIYFSKTIKDVKNQLLDSKQSDIDKSKNIQGLANNAVKVDKIKKDFDNIQENIDNANNSAHVISELDNLINNNNNKLHNSN